MEYRFFYPIDEEIYNKKWRTRSSVEHRTDIYFVLPSVENKSDELHLNYGLKLRNKRKLELKKRGEHFPNGQEYWCKTILSNTRVDINDKDSIMKILKNHNENQLIQRLCSSQPITLCYVEKYREQKPVGSRFIQELTGIQLKFFEWNNQTQIGKDLFFETACIEQSDSNLIDEKSIENFLKQYENYPINPMGYPQFLFRQYQSIKE